MPSARCEVPALGETVIVKCSHSFERGVEDLETATAAQLARNCQAAKCQESLSPPIRLRHLRPNRYAVCWPTSNTMQQSTVSRIVR